MRQVIIENPVINSPFAEPAKHYPFDDKVITNEIPEPHSVSVCSIFVPQNNRLILSQCAVTAWRSRNNAWEATESASSNTELLES